MYVADTLSRAYLKDPVSDDPELESVVHSVSKHLAVTPEKKKYSKKKPRKTKTSVLCVSEAMLQLLFLANLIHRIPYNIQHNVQCITVISKIYNNTFLLILHL